MDSHNILVLLTELCRVSGSNIEWNIETTRKECDTLREAVSELPVSVICYDQGKCYLSAAATQEELDRKESSR